MTIVKGEVLDERFRGMEKTFQENFENHLERAGAAFAVYYKGKRVIDLWGGLRDRENEIPWEKQTATVLFSTTKSVSAIVLAHVLNETGVSYNTKLIDFWPEYGKHGKEKTTISHVALHQAGLPYTDVQVTREDVTDWRKMSTYFENATPVWEPGTQTGYHALTIGFLIDQIVRRLDKEKRGITEIFSELEHKYGIREVSIGLPDELCPKSVAVLIDPSTEDLSYEGEDYEESLRRYNLGNNIHNDQLYKTWWWITVEDYNKLENRVLPMPSNMGIGTARGLAQLHSLLATKKILNEKMYDQLLAGPLLEDEIDICNGYPESKGYGWQFTKNNKGQWIFGHSGYGGQNVRVDLHQQLSYAYVCNGLKISDADLVPSFARLKDKLYDIMDTIQESNHSN